MCYAWLGRCVLSVRCRASRYSKFGISLNIWSLIAKLSMRLSVDEKLLPTMESCLSATISASLGYQSSPVKSSLLRMRESDMRRFL